MFFRDPRDVLKGKVDSKVNAKVYGARAKAVGAANNAVKGAAKKATGAGDAAPQKKKAKMGWWPFGSKEDGSEAPVCGSCGAEVDPSWRACPYCGAEAADGPPEAAAASQPPPPGGAPGPMVHQPGMNAPNKTVAIDLDALKGPRRSVVGWLVVMNGHQKGIDFRLFEGSNSIGAAADSDIVITDEYLSSNHAVIRYEDGRYELRDHESTNGSFVNEKRVSKEELIDNDSVRFGRTEFRFKALY